jgi:MSHA biogenesis protein MshP
MYPNKQTGFTIVGAIFLMVVLTAVSLYMVRISSVYHATNLLALQGARAYYAARSGLHWGIISALNPGGCPASPTVLNITNGGVDFNVTVTCAETPGVIEQTTPVPIYTINTNAVSANYPLNSIDYTSRRLSATVSGSPP